MSWMVVAFLFLAVPLSHQVIGHNVHRKLRRLTSRSRGPAVPPTVHELNHAAKPVWLRLLVNAAWLVYFLVVIDIAMGGIR